MTWALFALLLLIAGSRLKRMELYFQAYLLSLGAVAQVLMVNLYATDPFRMYPRVTLRLVTIVLTAALLYLSSRWAAKAEFGAAPIVAATYTGAGSALVWLLLLYELHSLNVAPGWAVFGLALFEVGYLRKFSNWRVQGYAIFASAFVRIFLENISASRHDLLVTTLPLAIIFYYAYWRLESRKRDFLTQDRQMLAGPILCYMGTATCATVLYYCLDAGWVAAGWAGLALLLIAVAWSARQEVFLHHSLLLAGAVLLRSVFFDLAEPSAASNAWFSSARSM